ncbi:hypothetical protein [Rhizosphaericola mali]|uniref:Uncharacterized protein n=1 Tax=Rhizosphaericola mali TaxID=2545455 RepID=A0A5P2G580_9BACT|nr:hypothetical protein [Rhizosphaericola mali]QES88910.1 hypothetical protein E0W69_009650 [Rhizosphaericola mali]
MKTNKNKFRNISLLIAALLMGVIVFASNKFTKTEQNVITKKVDTNFHYLGNDNSLASYKNPSNWEIVSSADAPGCSGDAFPCVVASSQTTVASFVASINSTSDVDDNTIRMKD